MSTIVYADGPGSARISPTDAAIAADAAAPTNVLLGWTIDQHPWLDAPTCPISTVLAGYGLARAVNDGRVTPLPVRLSAVAPLVASMEPDVGVISAVRRGDGLAFADSLGWGDVLARAARRLVVEVDPHGVDLGGPVIDGNIVAVVDRPSYDRDDAAVSRQADELDLAIGARVAALVPDDATLQFGPGGMGEGIARALDRPVRLWSGLCTEAMAELYGRGLLLAPVVAAYTWGGAAIERLATNHMLTLTSTTVTHDMSRLSAIPRFVGCNTALQVGLDGSANLERVGPRTIAAVGGHSDFCAGASRSAGGLSIIAVRSTSARGDSTIVPRVDVVSTQRSDIDVVITEHGVADLRGVSDAERAERLIAIAAPHHQSTLRSASS